MVQEWSEWSIPGLSIIAMCWDTTASNAGWKADKAVFFEAKLVHLILWIGCRHQRGELHVKHQDIKVRLGETTASEDVKFKMFLEIFIYHPVTIVNSNSPANLARTSDFVTCRDSGAFEWGKEQLRNGTFSRQRDDYGELCELMVY